MTEMRGIDKKMFSRISLISKDRCKENRQCNNKNNRVCLERLSGRINEKDGEDKSQKKHGWK